MPFQPVLARESLHKLITIRPEFRTGKVYAIEFFVLNRLPYALITFELCSKLGDKNFTHLRQTFKEQYAIYADINPCVRNGTRKNDIK
jgi:hypothetical protein